MADQTKSRQADWAPGTLDKTRQNIGDISDKEAAIMAKKLGGEVMYERSRNSAVSRTGVISRQMAGGNSSGGSSSQNGRGAGSGSSASSGESSAARKASREELPQVSKKVNSAIDRLMMSQDYQIKPNYGFFNFLRSLSKNGTEKLNPSFVDYSLKQDIEHLGEFITVIKKLIQIAPATYKTKIAADPDPKFKFLRMVATWQTQNIKNEYSAVQNLGQNVITADLIPFVRAIYNPIISVYYYGATKIPKLIKEIYSDVIAYPDAPNDVLSTMAKQAITEWLYIDSEITKRMYPLLMRMCSDTYESFPGFFNTKIADILKFLNLHKFDLLLPEKQKEVKKEEPKPRVQAPQKGIHDNSVIMGVKLLNVLFPEAGFDRLDEHPDFYPYFQPLYKFDEGFNMLSNENPIQVIVVLLRIIEDCLQGCRNIKFTVNDDPKSDSDSIYKILDDWSAYREEVFGRLYCEPLVDMVNSIYSQPDYIKSHIGKKMMNSLLWQVTYHFMPNFKFSQLILEHPADESRYRPLFHRTDFARKYLTLVINECDTMAKSHGDVKSVQNPWEHYKFDIPNEVSKRLDVILGAQNRTPSTNANNANLLKYTLSFISVLDWLINNPGSPAYATEPMHVYRVSASDGKPAFSVPERRDQNKLFADAIKASYQSKAK